MSLFAKRPRQEELGRRRPAAQQPRAGQNRTFSYYASRSSSEANVGRLLTQQEAPKRRRSHRARAFARRLPLIIASAVIVLCAISELNLGGQPKIVVISNSAEASGKLFLRPQDEYLRAATALFEKSASNRNKLTVDATGIGNKLEQQFPELSDVSVTLPVLGHRPIVYIQPSSPTMILTTASGRFILDESGRALLKAGDTAELGSLHLPTVTDQSGVSVRAGEAVLPSSEASFVHTIVAQLQAQHIAFTRIVLPKSASEVDMYISGQPYFAKFNTQNEALQQVGTFVATMRHLGAQHKTPTQYIDVRIDGRVYYK